MRTTEVRAVASVSYRVPEAKQSLGWMIARGGDRLPGVRHFKESSTNTRADLLSGTTEGAYVWFGRLTVLEEQ